MVPLLMAFMTSAEIGVLGAVEALMTVLAGLAQLGVKFAYLQEVADDRPGDRGVAFWTATTLTCVAGFVIGCAGALALASGAAARFLGMQLAIHWAILGGLLLAMNLQMMLVTDLRANRNPLPFAFASAARVLVVIGATWMLFRLTESRVEAALLAQLASLLVSIALLFGTAHLPRRVGFAAPLARKFVRYGAPIAAGGMLKYATDALLPWLSIALVSPVAGGAVVLALKASAVFDACFGLPFLMAWGGRVYHLIKERTVRVVAGRLFFESLRAAAVAALLSGGIAALLLVSRNDYAALAAMALTLLPLALLQRMAFMLRSPASAGLFLTRKMDWNVAYGAAGLLAYGLVGPWLYLGFGAAGGWLALVLIDAITVAHMYRRSSRLLGESPTRSGALA